MNILKLFNTNIIESLKKEYIKEDNTIKSKALVELWVYNKFPEFEKVFKENFTHEQFREVIYCLLRDIEYIPKCENPNCNNDTKLRNFVIGFQKCCCKKCVAEYQHLSEDHKIKVQLGQQNFYKTYKRKDEYTQLLNCDYSKPNYYIFKNYCKHGDATVYFKTANKIHEINQSTFCLHCNQDIIDNYIPTDTELDNFIIEFPEFYKKYNHMLKYQFFLLYYPYKLACLITYYNKYIGKYNKDITDLSELYYVVLNNIKTHPICNHTGCNKYVKFYMSGYNKFCDTHAIGYNTSSIETEVYDFLLSLNKNIIRNDRTILSGKEIDFYFPCNNIGIEFNGCLWHSTFCTQKAKTYHLDKRIEALNNNVTLYTIWEDDWRFKQNIIKSIIKSWFNIYDLSVHINNCIIKTISKNELNLFLQFNSLEGSVISSKYIFGIFYNNELISVISFIKSKLDNTYKISRYCNKLNTFIIRGLTGFIKYFIQQIKTCNIVYYNNNDISNCTIFYENGFILENTILTYSWMQNGGKRTNNKNNAKYKCYTSGQSKLIKKLM